MFMLLRVILIVGFYAFSRHVCFIALGDLFLIALDQFFDMQSTQIQGFWQKVSEINKSVARGPVPMGRPTGPWVTALGGAGHEPLRRPGPWPMGQWASP